MPVSTMTLTTARVRVGAIVMDAGALVLANAQIDQGMSLALEEYNRVALTPRSPVLPRDVIGTVTPALGAFEFSIATLTPVPETVQRVWYPYTASSPENPPRARRFQTFRNAGTISIRLGDGYAGDGSTTARIFYRALHTLNGLDSASATTFEASDDNLLCLGAAGYGCLARARGLNEATATAEVQTPNYGDIGVTLLAAFHDALKPLRRMIVKGI